jgi:hypothetical protein
VSKSYISNDLRRLVRERAKGLCEYCLIHEDDAYLGCQVDHIISEKHGGLTDESNLAYACIFCNRYKGSDIASLSKTNILTRFYNPRQDKWSEHFSLLDVEITALTEIGEVTVRILDMNHNERLLERQELKELSRYPSKEAVTLITES